MATEYRCIFRNLLGTGLDVVSSNSAGSDRNDNKVSAAAPDIYPNGPFVATVQLTTSPNYHSWVSADGDYFDSIAETFEEENSHLENLTVDSYTSNLRRVGDITLVDDEGTSIGVSLLFSHRGNRPIVDYYMVNPLSNIQTETRDDGLEYYRVDFVFNYSYGPETDPDFGNVRVQDQFTHSVYVPASAVQDDLGRLPRLRTLGEIANLYKLLQFNNVEVMGPFVNDSAPSIECIEVPVVDDSLEYNSELVLTGGPEYVGTQITSITHDNREPLPVFNITINAGEGSLAPFNDLAPFYQERVRSSVEQVLMETDGVSIRQWALESDFLHTSLKTMDLNELVELLTHVAVVGR